MNELDPKPSFSARRAPPRTPDAAPPHPAVRRHVPSRCTSTIGPA